MVTDWYTITIQALQDLWQGILGFIPTLLGAIVVFVIGWFVALGAGKLVTEVLARLKFNKLFERMGWQGAFEKAKLDVNPSEFLGAIVKWTLVIVFLLASVEILGLIEFAGFLKGILLYIPNVFVAALILVVAAIVADILEKIVVASVEKVIVGFAHLAGMIVKWAIWIFATLAILYQLGVAPAFMEILFTGLIAVLVISLGLAFGLGGKEVAAELLQDLKGKLKGE